MRVYVINLATATKRREAIEQQLQALSLPFEICTAVDGRVLSEEALAQVYDAQRAAQQFRPLSTGEIGCALSHLAVYERFLQSGEPWALVLEDDAKLGEKLPEVLSLLATQAEDPGPAVTLLTRVNKYARRRHKRLNAEFSLVNPYQDWWWAHGYVINRSAAQILTTQLAPVWTVADAWNCFSDAGWIRLRATVPYCIGHSELAQVSSLETDRAVLEDAGKTRTKPLLWYVKHYGYTRFLYQVLVRPFLRVAKQPIVW